MKRAILIARRECQSAFDSPIAYLVMAALPALAALFFFVLGPFFVQQRAEMRGFFSLLPLMLILVAPAITMRMWSEERRSGTEELLFSYPFRVRDLVLGKFLGALALLALSLFATGFVPCTVAWLGPLDWGPVFAGYLGALLLGGACIAAGLFLSALTENQIVAWLSGVLLLAALNLPSLLMPLLPVSDQTARILLAVDLQERFQSLARGVIDFGDLIYFLSVIVLFLSWMGLVLENRRFR